MAVSTVVPLNNGLGAAPIVTALAPLPVINTSGGSPIALGAVIPITPLPGNVFGASSAM